MNATSLLSLGCLIAVIGGHTVQAGCEVPMSGGLPDPAPLLLVAGERPDAPVFKRPTPDGQLTFTAGEEVRVVCPGAGNFFTGFDGRPQDIRVTCSRGATFRHAGRRLSLSSLTCASVPTPTTLRAASRCNSGRHQLFYIGFQLGAFEFVHLFDVCFDEQRLTTVWSRSDLLSAIRGEEPGFTPSGVTFYTGDLFSGIDPDKIYSRRTQRVNIASLIGTSQANYYINSTHYLARGVLTDTSTFIYRAQKEASLNFINVAPQWSKYRKGLWGVVETRVRRYADSSGNDLVVYTGTHGVTTLPDASASPSEHELYLSVKGRTRQVAVPALFWKVVYEPASGRAVVLVSVNNPHKRQNDLDADPGRYKVCSKFRYISRWYVCTSADEWVGLGYCCELDDFRNYVTSLPDFEVTGLLT